MGDPKRAADEAALEKLRKSSLPLVIFGADVVGEVLFHACEEAGLEVAFFCDNNKNKVAREFCGRKVVHAPELPKLAPEAVFLVASTYIRDIAAQLRDLGYDKFFEAGVLLRNFDIFKFETSYSRPMHFVDFAVGACLLSQSGYVDPDRLYLRGVDLIITERCSMRCKDCANLMQYYQAPKNMTVDSLFGTIEKFLSVIDEIYEVRVIGGEPLMNPEYHKVVARLTGEPKVRRVVVYSNGTILPKEEHLPILRDRKVIFIFTDYGDLSRKLADTTKLFDRHGVNYVVQKAAGWTDSGQIGKHGRSEEALKQQFQFCCVKNYTSISDGRLYRCPFSANAARLKATPDDPEDYFDLFRETATEPDLAAVKRKIRAFLSEKEFLRACDFCNGRTYGSPEIQPAVQAHRALEYARF